MKKVLVQGVLGMPDISQFTVFPGHISVEDIIPYIHGDYPMILEIPDAACESRESIVSFIKDVLSQVSEQIPHSMIH